MRVFTVSGNVNKDVYQPSLVHVTNDLFLPYSLGFASGGEERGETAAFVG